MIIAAFGDSITEARTGILPEEGWDNLLRKALGPSHTLINAGVGGNSAREAAARWERDVLARKPDYILLELGGNNHDPRPGHEARRVGDEEFLEILRKLHASLPANFPAAALTFPPVIDERHQFSPLVPGGKVDEEAESQRRILRDFAAESGWDLLDLHKIFFPRRHELILPDGVHLNAAGNRLLKEKVWELLKKRFPREFEEPGRTDKATSDRKP
ncbi:MAG: SGNH/GDSL hydrolase family protein [Lentisphaeria bacterium]|nr:SGNH/GDSL hydrolase family protein [Lentisphaeria bacterium]